MPARFWKLSVGFQNVPKHSSDLVVSSDFFFDHKQAQAKIQPWSGTLSWPQWQRSISCIQERYDAQEYGCCDNLVARACEQTWGSGKLWHFTCDKLLKRQRRCIPFTSVLFSQAFCFTCWEGVHSISLHGVFSMFRERAMCAFHSATNRVRTQISTLSGRCRTNGLHWNVYAEQHKAVDVFPLLEDCVCCQNILWWAQSTNVSSDGITLFSDIKFRKPILLREYTHSQLCFNSFQELRGKVCLVVLCRIKSLYMSRFWCDDVDDFLHFSLSCVNHVRSCSTCGASPLRRDGTSLRSQPGASKITRDQRILQFNCAKLNPWALHMCTERCTGSFFRAVCFLTSEQQLIGEEVQRSDHH